MNVYQIYLKVYMLQNIQAPATLEAIADFIDSALAGTEEWLPYHEENRFKYYCFSGFWPVEKGKEYRTGSIYTVTLRTTELKLAQFFSSVLKNHYTETMKGLTADIRIIPRKIIGELYTLTPVIIKTDKGYWRKNMSLEDYEKRLFVNAVKKYNQCTGEKIDENFCLYTGLNFLNRKPAALAYSGKGICLLGDKLRLNIADNENAQNLAYFLLGTGIGEVNARGGGFCNYKWI